MRLAVPNEVKSLCENVLEPVDPNTPSFRVIWQSLQVTVNRATDLSPIHRSASNDYVITRFVACHSAPHSCQNHSISLCLKGH